jgi:hypothetical protein
MPRSFPHEYPGAVFDTFCSESQPAVHKFAVFIQAVAEAGSVHPLDIQFSSPIRCRKRPNHRPCPGRILITPKANQIEWMCGECGSGGTVTGWRDCDCDLSKFCEGKAASALVLRLFEDEYRTLTDVLVVSGEEAALVAGAVWTGNGVERGSKAADDLDGESLA